MKKLMITLGAAPLMALACNMIVFPLDDDGGGGGTTTGESTDGSSGPGATSGGSVSVNGGTEGSTAGSTVGSTDTGTEGSQDGTDGSQATGTTTGDGCTPQVRPYGECDLDCPEPCSDGRTCIGDPVTGEASCADACESAQDCPVEIYPRPWAEPACSPAPESGIPGSWCGIPCAAEDACPNVTSCVDLGGVQPLCIG